LHVEDVGAAVVIMLRQLEAGNAVGQLNVIVDRL
jgi:hypothetical protein